MIRSRQAPPSSLTLRLATAEDAPRVIRLAALDSARPPQAPVLLAEVGDELWVAVSLADHRSVADPFRRTADVRAAAIAFATAREPRDGHP